MGWARSWSRKRKLLGLTLGWRIGDGRVGLSISWARFSLGHSPSCSRSLWYTCYSLWRRINANRLPALPSASAPLVRWEDVTPSSSFSSSTTMKTFLLIVAVSLNSAANVKRDAEPDAEATAEADASADPAYGRHHGHAGESWTTKIGKHKKICLIFSFNHYGILSRA